MADANDASVRASSETGSDAAWEIHDSHRELVTYEMLHMIDDALSEGLVVAHRAMQADRERGIQAEAATRNLMLFQSMAASCRKTVLTEFGKPALLNSLTRRLAQKDVTPYGTYIFFVNILLFGSPLDSSLYGPATAIAKAIFETYRNRIELGAYDFSDTTWHTRRHIDSASLIEGLVGTVEAYCKRVRLDVWRILSDAARAINASAGPSDQGPEGKVSVKREPQDDDPNGLSQDSSALSSSEGSGAEADSDHGGCQDAVKNAMQQDRLPTPEDAEPNTATPNADEMTLADQERNEELSTSPCAAVTSEALEPSDGTDGTHHPPMSPRSAPSDMSINVQVGNGLDAAPQSVDTSQHHSQGTNSPEPPSLSMQHMHMTVEDAIPIDDDDDDEGNPSRSASAPCTSLKRKLGVLDLSSDSSDESTDELDSDSEYDSEDDTPLAQLASQSGSSKQDIIDSIDMTHPSIGARDPTAPRVTKVYDILSKALAVIRQSPHYQNCHPASFLLKRWSDKEIIQEIKDGFTTGIGKMLIKLANGDPLTFEEALALQKQSESRKRGLGNVRLLAFQCANQEQRDAADAQNVHALFVANQKHIDKSAKSIIRTRNGEVIGTYARLAGPYGFGDPLNKSSTILVYQLPKKSEKSLFSTWKRSDSPFQSRMAMQDAFLNLTKCVMICACWTMNCVPEVNKMLRQAFPRAAPLIGLNISLPLDYPYQTKRQWKSKGSKKVKSGNVDKGKPLSSLPMSRSQSLASKPALTRVARARSNPEDGYTLISRGIDCAVHREPNGSNMWIKLFLSKMQDPIKVVFGTRWLSRTKLQVNDTIRARVVLDKSLALDETGRYPGAQLLFCETLDGGLKREHKYAFPATEMSTAYALHRFIQTHYRS